MPKRTQAFGVGWRTLDTPGEGKVLVVDGAGYLGSALIGDERLKK